MLEYFQEELCGPVIIMKDDNSDLKQDFHKNVGKNKTRDFSEICEGCGNIIDMFPFSGLYCIVLLESRAV